MYAFHVKRKHYLLIVGAMLIASPYGSRASAISEAGWLSSSLTGPACCIAVALRSPPVPSGASLARQRRPKPGGEKLLIAKLKLTPAGTQPAGLTRALGADSVACRGHYGQLQGAPLFAGVCWPCRLMPRSRGLSLAS